MGGKYSRSKGSRGERDLVADLKLQGWPDARRIPLSGAMQGFKGDVVARHPSRGTDTLFECKLRGGQPFKALYAAMQTSVAGEVAFSLPDGEGEVVMSYTAFSVIGASCRIYVPASKETMRAVRKLQTLRKLLGEAEVLAVRQDRGRFIYIKYFT